MSSETQKRFQIGWRDATRLDFDRLQKVKYSSDKIYSVGASNDRKTEVLIDAKFNFHQENSQDLA